MSEDDRVDREESGQLRIKGKLPDRGGLQISLGHEGAALSLEDHSVVGQVTGLWTQGHGIYFEATIDRGMEDRVQALLGNLDRMHYSSGVDLLEDAPRDDGVSGECSEPECSDGCICLRRAFARALDDRVSRQVVGRYSEKDGVEPYGYVIRRPGDGFGDEGA